MCVHTPGTLSIGTAMSYISHGIDIDVGFGHFGVRKQNRFQDFLDALRHTGTNITIAQHKEVLVLVVWMKGEELFAFECQPFVI